MNKNREAIDRMNQCMNRLDRLYYIAARKLGVKDNSLLLYYVLNDGKAHSQKEISEEWLVPRTTLNTVVKEEIEKDISDWKLRAVQEKKHHSYRKWKNICGKSVVQSFCGRGAGSGTDHAGMFTRISEGTGSIYRLYAGRVPKGNI